MIKKILLGLVAVITGHISLSQIKKTGEQGNILAIIGLILGYLEIVGVIIFGIVWIVTRLAPLGAFGAMAYTVGEFGLKALENLLFLMFAFYLTAAVFVFGVLGLILRALGLSIWDYLVGIREEIFLVLGTSSSETAIFTSLSSCSVATSRA